MSFSLDVTALEAGLAKYATEVIGVSASDLMLANCGETLDQACAEIVYQAQETWGAIKRDGAPATIYVYPTIPAFVSETVLIGVRYDVLPISRLDAQVASGLVEVDRRLVDDPWERAGIEPFRELLENVVVIANDLYAILLTSSLNQPAIATESVEDKGD
jgi:hypothetical protein